MRNITKGSEVTLRHVSGAMKAAGVKRGETYKVARVSLENKKHIVELEGLKGLKFRFNSIVPVEQESPVTHHVQHTQEASFAVAVKELASKYGADVTLKDGVFTVKVGGLTFTPKAEEDLLVIYSVIRTAHFDTSSQ